MAITLIKLYLWQLGMSFIAMLWHIRCPRCHIHEPFIVEQVCQILLQDTIHVGMARIRHFNNNFSQHFVKKRESIVSKFINIWCKNKAFFSSCFNAYKWKLIPALILFPLPILGNFAPLGGPLPCIKLFNASLAFQKKGSINALTKK
jgi:hypothetical protein